MPKNAVKVETSSEVDFNKVRKEIKELGYSGPHRLFSEAMIKPFEEEILAFSSDMFTSDDRSLTNQQRLRQPVKNMAANVINQIKKKITLSVADYSRNAIAHQIFQDLFGNSRCKPCSNFQDFRINIPNTGLRTGWHQDAETFFIAGWEHGKYLNYTMWISLNGGRETDSLEIVPKSHLTNRLYEQSYANTAKALGDIEPLFSDYKSVKIVCQPGDVVFLDTLTFHRTVKNENSDNSARFSMDLRFYDPGIKNYSYRIDAGLYWRRFLFILKNVKWINRLFGKRAA